MGATMMTTFANARGKGNMCALTFGGTSVSDDLQEALVRSLFLFRPTSEGIQCSRSAATCLVAILRLAGIYGPGRNALKNLQHGTAKRIVKPGQVFNRTHVADIAQAIDAAFDRRANGIFNITDDAEHGLEFDVAHAFDVQVKARRHCAHSGARLVERYFRAGQAPAFLLANAFCAKSRTWLSCRRSDSISEGVSILEVEDVMGLVSGERGWIEVDFLSDDIAEPPLNFRDLLAARGDLADAG